MGNLERVEEGEEQQRQEDIKEGGRGQVSQASGDARQGAGSRECRMCIQAKGNMSRRVNETIKKVVMEPLGPPIVISHKLMCSSKNMVYVAKDLQYGKVYIGQSGREIRRRHADHLGDIEQGDERKLVLRYFLEKNLTTDNFWMILMRGWWGQGWRGNMWSRRSFTSIELTLDLIRDIEI